MSNPNNPNFSYDIYGDVDAKVDAAYVQNVAAGIAVPQPDRAILDALNASDAQPAEAELTPEFQQSMEVSRAASSELFNRIGLSTPELPEFVAAGLNFKQLGAAHETMTGLGLQPELIFAPGNLKSKEWQTVYKALQNDTTVNPDNHIRDGGLWIYSLIEADWDKLTTSRHSIDVNGRGWQVSVLPGTDRPSFVHIDHDGRNASNYSKDLEDQAAQLDIASFDLLADNFHPTIASYLTLQAIKLQTQRQPVDNETLTWLAGEFGNPTSLRAPVGHWYSNDGRLRLFWGEVGYQFDHLGVRLPVWGDK